MVRIEDKTVGGNKPLANSQDVHSVRFQLKIEQNCNL